MYDLWTMQEKIISLVKVPRSFKYTYKNRALWMSALPQSLQSDIEETNTKKYATEASS